MTCRIPDCESNTDASLCDMHRKRLQRGTPLHAPKQLRLSPSQRALDASLALADVDSEDDYEFQAAMDRWRKAIERMFAHLRAKKASLSRWAGLTLTARQRATLAATLARRAAREGAQPQTQSQRNCPTSENNVPARSVPRKRQKK